MIRPFLKPAFWIIASMCLIYSFTVEGAINPSFYRSISLVFFLATLSMQKKDSEIALIMNEDRNPMQMETKSLSLDIKSILRDKKSEVIDAYMKYRSNRGE